MSDGVIVRCAIHPAIGVARVGNSPNGYFIGPEVSTPPPATVDQHRDPAGRLKRQAAKFRIYGYDAFGNVVRELTSDDAQIEWTAHLVNAKAAWYQFDRALDIPEAVGTSVPLRNPTVTDRATLIIDPGSRTISGERATPQAFDNGTFMGETVYLGELRTDPKGRLVVLGGRGVSNSPTGAPIYDPNDSSSFNNANEWHDDTSDGPVTARVVVDGVEIACEPAWVVVTPPNYGPDVLSWRTMYDLRMDVARVAGAEPLPERPSFTEHILPMFQRLTGLQWVNQGFAAFFGDDAPMDFFDATLLARLNAAPDGDSDPWQELRRTCANSFRQQQFGDADPGTWPWVYGDGFGTQPGLLPNENLPLPPTWQYFLSKWIDGDFVSDWDPTAKPPRHLRDVPLADQPHTLDRAALDFCLADAFHPGCEITWPMRHQSLFSSTLRIQHATGPEIDLGSTLDPVNVKTLGGPLYGQRPGDMTRWMALPWQMDTGHCRSGYDPDYDPYVPTFWAARAPNQVLTQDTWDAITAAPEDQRVALFQQRANWLRALPSDVGASGMWVVDNFDKLGVVLRHDGVPGLPAHVWVEDLPSAHRAAARQAHQDHVDKIRTGTPEDARAVRAGWGSRAHLNQVRALLERRRS